MELENYLKNIGNIMVIYWINQKNIGILLEEERHLVGHIKGQLAQKLFVDIIKTWQKKNYPAAVTFCCCNNQHKR